MSFQKSFFVAVLAAVLCASLSEAAPWPASSKHATHRRRLVGRGVSLESYHPQPKFQTFGEGKLMADAQSFAQPDGLKSNVMNWLATNLQVNSSNLEWTSGWAAENGLSCGYVKQVHDGVPFTNAVANVAFQKNNAISFGNSFVATSNIAPSKPTVDVDDAISTAESTLGGTHNGIEPALQYLAQPDGSAALVHAVQIENEADQSFVEAYVDAHSGKLVSVNDFVADASFRALPIDKKLISDGLELIKDPESLDVSPLGWNNDGTTNTTDTTGNNAVVVKLSGQNQVQSTLGKDVNGQLTFDFTYDQKKDPTDPTNIDAARTNGFFIANEYHDILYRYGFTEKAFNFQNTNFGKGGAEADPVLMSVQDPSGTNNANFATPPDGQPGQCRMFIFDLTNPRQDGAMENAVPVHELTHGVTNRMTGGGTGRCLQSLQAGGMGEGWSDAVADWMTQTTAQTQDFVVGQGVSGKAGGLRSKPYSVDPAVNPLKYSDIGKLQEVHQIGEVWANTLHTVYADLVTSLGFNANAKTDPTGKEGNVVWMNLIITGLTLQPCNPTVLDARDAIVQADKTLNNGANECTLRTSFAKKGLGLNATPDFQDDDTVPANCK
ncbi:hypothetical protein E1B28_013147 [Marasmius oreades]|uniref:Extracellular metalloproteinase n=1 Tax=Marasmius oreades TaxID=181124 RepID=A0A9P7ULP9_9AGAR|nr:uncharacterized protein E1B28_013147 [Marasmius oreades]KAG7087167.1 hypothetical protein E1B28_013147 [Marasmius oreades]